MTLQQAGAIIDGTVFGGAGIHGRSHETSFPEPWFTQFFLCAEVRYGAVVSFFLKRLPTVCRGEYR